MRSFGLKVFDAYLSGEYKEGKNYVRKTIFFINDTIYSYGEHFPMAVNMGGWYLVNGDLVSVTTARHQAYLRESLTRKKVKFAIIPFSALNSAGIDISRIKYIDLEKEKTMLVKIKNKAGEMEEKLRHLLGSVVFEFNNRYFLSGVDESGTNAWRSYFLAELPYKVSSVEEAYNALKPEEVKQAERLGLEVKRQGEWFFIPVDKEINIKLNKEKNVSRSALLPNRDRNRRLMHLATRLFTDNKKMYAKGTVRHLEKQHRMLTLPSWYEVYENTQINSWVSSGKID